jgi:hypothetical protein
VAGHHRGSLSVLVENALAWPRALPSVDSLRIVRLAARVVIVLLGGIQVLAYPNRMSSDDVVSYLDIADAYRHHPWKSAINGYWSPLYSWVLGFGEWVVRPAASQEFSFVRLVNFTVYLLALAAFELFLRRAIAAHEHAVDARVGENASLRIPRWMWLLFGYSVFLWSSLKWIGLRTDTPDLCTAALVYVAASILIGGRSAPLSSAQSVTLGAVLGLAYLSKTAMFPVAFAFLAAGSLTGRDRSRAIGRAAWALGAFALVTLPFIVSLSTVKHRATFGDSGRMNYAWQVNPGGYIIPGLHWQGGPGGFGVPSHPTRQISHDPAVFEFDHGFHTFPPWGDPSYWYDGLRIRFNLTAELKTIAANLQFYAPMFLMSVGVFYLVLLCFDGFFESVAATVNDHWRLLVPAAAGLAVYMVCTNLAVADIRTQPSTRYVAVFVVLLLTAVVSGVRLPDSRRSRRLLAVITVTAATIIVGRLSFLAADDLKLGGRPLPEQQIQTVVWRLREAGVQPGDRVAILGSKGAHEFWARLGRIRIVAQIPDEDAFFRADAKVQQEIRAELARTGAKALMYRRMPHFDIGPQWRRLGRTDHYMIMLVDSDQPRIAGR